MVSFESCSIMGSLGVDEADYSILPVVGGRLKYPPTRFQTASAGFMVWVSANRDKLPPALRLRRPIAAR